MSMCGTVRLKSYKEGGENMARVFIRDLEIGLKDGKTTEDFVDALEKFCQKFSKNTNNKGTQDYVFTFEKYED